MTNQSITSGSGSVNDMRSGDSPFIFEFFLVQGISFRCMAYRDNDGKWRGAFNNMELPGAVRILF